MKAYLVAHIFLLPFLVFTTLAPFGFPILAAMLGVTIGIVACALRYGFEAPPVFMAAQVLGVALVLSLLLLGLDLKVTDALAIVFAFLSAGATISVLQYKRLM